MALVLEYISDAFAPLEDEFWLDRPFADTFVMRLRLPGGKGGFGSNLRAQGNKMSNKKRNLGQESCRNLDGQRLRTINQNRLVSEYLARKPEMDRKREREIKEKMTKIIEAADRKPKYQDLKFERLHRETVDNVQSAVFDALQDILPLDEEAGPSTIKSSSVDVFDDEDETSKGKEKIVLV